MPFGVFPYYPRCIHCGDWLQRSVALLHLDFEDGWLALVNGSWRCPARSGHRSLPQPLPHQPEELTQAAIFLLDRYRPR